LSRCSNESIEKLEQVNRSTILFKFPKVMPKKGTTTLVLKAPKTESSNRTIYLPQAVIEELRQVKAQQEEYKKLLGEEYRDYDLVVAQMNGHPYEQRVIDKQFYKLIEKNKLRPVVFHSLRHSSTSLKLKLSRGNIKAVQGDTGHAEARMVTDTYAHSFDADRKLIAQEMDTGFFSKVGVEQKPIEADAETVERIKLLLRQHPELLTELLNETSGEREKPDENG
jgi:integrase